MNDIQILYPGFKSKCFTLSYDDGVLQDIPFLEMINLYGVKATFNLNSGLFGQIKYRDGVNNSRIKEEDLGDLYKGHEIASHSLYHFHLERKSYEENLFQIEKDKENLQKIFSTEIKGFAYPYGTYSEDTLKVLKSLGFIYARTTKPSYSFELSENCLLLQPTCSHSDKNLIKIALDFTSSKIPLALFYVWGHTYEFDNSNNWNVIRDLLNILKDDKDIAYLTNISAITYILEARKILKEKEYVLNQSSIDLYLKIDGEEILLKPNEKYIFKEEK